ncbi:hypothetical protein CHISP_2958 [Chitinispirillum alkaliphilum]|nr:hypothetical protein CHISP_2958 [Chitinispirillum alkaliphilum]
MFYDETDKQQVGIIVFLQNFYFCTQREVSLVFALNFSESTNRLTIAPWGM